MWTEKNQLGTKDKQGSTIYICTHTQVMRERQREREEWIVNHQKKIINNRIMNQYQNVM